MGSLLIIGLNYIIMYIMNRGRKNFLYFGIYCINIAVRYIIVGHSFYIFFEDKLNFMFRMKLEYINFYFGLMLLVIFMKGLFYKEYNKYLVNSIIIVSIIFIINTVIFPFRIFDLLNYAYQTFSLLTGIFLLYGIIVAAYRNREGARVLVLGFIIMLVMAGMDILTTMGVIRYPSMGAFGLYVFVFFQSIVLSYSYSKAYNTVEVLSKRLLKVNKLKDEFLANTS